ncbi:hypothetical protein CR513_57435, partial [Mucuna pruriens]
MIGSIACMGGVSAWLRSSQPEPLVAGCELGWTCNERIGHPIQARAPDIQSLRYWSSCLKGQWCRAFEKTHGNFLRILDIETQLEALEALVQYYDPPARCFTFRDFQLAPTLEEYERLLGLPLTKSAQYFHQDQPPSWAMIAGLLRVPEAEMAKAKRNRNDLEGLPKVYLEQRLCQLQEEEEWPAVMDVLVLLLYGILLFPQVEDFVDLIAIKVFMAERDRWENPTMAVLANTYYTLNH